eukprot:1364367-Amorphochlora_amoeboformis.AAC.1
MRSIGRKDCAFKRNERGRKQRRGFWRHMRDEEREGEWIETERERERRVSEERGSEERGEKES